MTDCIIPGNASMYGLGIRLGLYFQWTSTVLSIGWVPAQEGAMRDVNISFTIALLISLLYISIMRQSSASEIVTILSLCSGGAVLSAATRPQTWFAGIVPRGSRGRIGVLVQNTLVALVTYYQLWFFYIGMDSMGYSSCKQYQFFFAKVSIYGWSRRLNQAVVTLWAVIATIALGRFICKTLVRDADRRHAQLENEAALHVACAMTATKILVFLVLNAELVIRWNNIQGVQKVNNTGQVIPLIIGLLGFIKTGYLLILKNIPKQPSVGSEESEMNTIDHA